MKLLLFKQHAGDPLSGAIHEITDTDYTHAAILIDEVSLTIIEAWFPQVRERQLADGELAGIDVFAVQGITPEQEAGVVAYLKQAVADHAAYSVKNLFSFLPAIRDLIGTPQDADANAAVFCSQLAFDAIDRGGGIKLLNAPSYKMAPGYLGWSPLLVQQTALKSPVAAPSLAQDASLSPEPIQTPPTPQNDV